MKIVRAAKKIYAVQFLREDCVRIRIRRDEAFRAPEREMVVIAPLPDRRASLQETARATIMASKLLSLRIDRVTGGFSLYNAREKLVLQCLKAPVWAKPANYREATRDATHMGDGTKIIISEEEHRDRQRYIPAVVWRLEFKVSPADHFYGFGMLGGAVDCRGRKIDTWLRHFDADDYRTPYFYSTAGGSLFVREAERMVFDVAKSDPKRIKVQGEDADELDLYLQVGSLKECLQSYTWLTGRSPDLPAWVFGNWMGGYWKDQQALLATAREFRKREIPLDVMRQDSCWQDRHECDFRWDTNYPDPAGMLSRLAAMGLKLHLWKAPVVNYNCITLADGLNKDAFLKNRDGSLPLVKWWKPDRGCIVDFTNPAAWAWWQEQLRPLLEMGVIGFKTDGGNERYFIMHDRLFHDGRTGKQAHNIYPLLYAKCIFEAQRGVHKQNMPIWIRAGYAGIQRYPILWAGDQGPRWESLLQQVHAGISAGLSGVSFWSSDGGGFSGTPAEDLYIRGVQFAFWNPVAQVFGHDREPWFFSEKACAIFKSCAIWRNRLNPYIAGLAAVATQSGLPMMRHMILEFPDDETCLGIDDQYMFGPVFLVAPVLSADARRRIYFPAGDWADLHTGKIITGPIWKDLTVPLEIIPVYARCGYLTPIKPVSQYIEQVPNDALECAYWAGAQRATHWHNGVTGDALAESGAPLSQANLLAYCRKWIGANSAIQRVGRDGAMQSDDVKVGHGRHKPAPTRRVGLQK